MSSYEHLRALRAISYPMQKVVLPDKPESLIGSAVYLFLSLHRIDLIIKMV